MNRPTYAEQERHLHEQYIAGLLHPYDIDFCICGNMLGERCLSDFKPWPYLTYTQDQLNSIEWALIDTIHNNMPGCGLVGEKRIGHPLYETALFNGMVAALAVLKEGHRGWGEDVDNDQAVFVNQRNVIPV